MTGISIIIAAILLEHGISKGLNRIADAISEQRAQAQKEQSK